MSAISKVRSTTRDPPSPKPEYATASRRVHRRSRHAATPNTPRASATAAAQGITTEKSLPPSAKGARDGKNDGEGNGAPVGPGVDRNTGAVVGRGAGRGVAARAVGARAGERDAVGAAVGAPQKPQLSSQLPLSAAHASSKSQFLRSTSQAAQVAWPRTRSALFSHAGVGANVDGARVGAHVGVGRCVGRGVGGGVVGARDGVAVRGRRDSSVGSRVGR